METLKFCVEIKPITNYGNLTEYFTLYFIILL